MEGGVYNCRWEKQGGHFKAWVENQPALTATAGDFDEASENLSDVICKELGDGEAVLEFDPPPPAAKNLKSYLTPETVALKFNSSAEGIVKQEGLYEGGYCNKCGAGVGPRTQVPVRIIRAPTGDLAGIRTQRPSVIRIFSDAFLALLKPLERAKLQFQPVEFTGKGRRTYHELRGPIETEFVGVKNGVYQPIPNWQCAACGYKTVHCHYPAIKRLDYNLFLPRSKMPAVMDCFVARKNQALTLCLSRERWKQIKGKPGTKGIVTSPICYIADDEVEWNPPVRIEQQAN